MPLVGATGWRPDSLPLPSLPVLLLLDLLKGLRDVAGPSLPDRPSDKVTKRRARVFSQGQLQLVSPIRGAFFLQNLRRKEKHVDIHKGLTGGGDSVRKKDGTGGLEGPLTGAPELVLSTCGWKSLFEKVGRAG